jgi:hypothetical protein
MALTFETHIDISSFGRQPHSENIVANISLYNPVTATTKIPANIDVGLEKPILRKCSDYKLTILRFQCPLTSVFPPFTINGQIFTMTVNWNNTSSTITVTGNQTMNSITDFCRMFTKLLSDCIAACYSDPNNLPPAARPYLFFQPETRLFYLFVPNVFLPANGNFIDIIINQSLHKYISGFLFDKLDNYYGPSIDGYRLKPFPTADDNFNYTSPRGIEGTGYKFSAEYPTDYRFNQLQSVIVTSNIPVRMETLPQSTQQAVSNPNNSVSYISTLPILTDFRPDVNQYGLQNSSLIYFPTAEYRWTDLMSDAPLDRLSFNFLW